ncbi:ABC transporter ATP-binding protein [Halomonas borealis]|uniref:ABC transporter ATP-binding protein n=1 Tax=Halomonas borealis TaxID=2508710 RepID=UPI00109F9E5D|nr:ABC transporter ATP-binding protein [Halomonas borealis]
MTPSHRLETRSLSLAYGRTPIIEELAVALPPGKVTAIVGPNGCGKSTLLAGLARLHAPSAGAVLLDGEDIRRLPTRELARRLALLPQEATAPEGLTVGELIRFGRQPHQGWWRQWSGDDQRAVEAAVVAAGLEALAERPLEALSGGQRQRAWIAMTIAQQTPLLLLDEPTSALDLGHQLEVFELVRRLAADGRTLALVLHDLASACRYADHLIAMRDGRIVAQGSPAEVVTEALVHELYGVTCTLIPDPASGAPLLADLRRA